ncbi:SusD/RagB family nutrient-binding outer membrane lipoprotein [Paraflavitalea speifideaquila]|uniref:SusD/RagB family nutrient-binding outer membrane lipoprotein n=1 Tax=Paraflavitalea speifideaquila TaxID=3076558 RepID=UPI0028E460DD|nr:SusD/RagB family nutrient-binding outer membrane lipoprotein [Paraflavitalea speifideiaquila]
MKKLTIKSGLLLSAIALLASCKKFEEINMSPKDASADQVQVEYFLNNSIVSAQMDPHIAERVFVLYWKTAGHQQHGGGISSGTPDDGWSTDYYRYISEWLNHANTAIQVADEKIAANTIKPYTGNLKQAARIWRAYLMSELSDNFGPMPLNGFQGVNPQFSSVKDVYYFLLDELKDASSKLDLAIVNAAGLDKLDPAFGYNWAKWKRYANSMRLRLAMRLSEVDAAKAKSEFEAAVTGDLITSMDHAFQVQEKSGWDALTGVMSREWNSQILSTTMENIFTGLGGVKSADLVPASMQSMIKPANYAGLKLIDHFSTMNNEPYAGYWMDGLPNTIDPRAYKAFPLPGDFTNADFTKYPSYDQAAWETTKRNLMSATNTVVRELEGKFTWNGTNGGDWGVKGTRNQWRGWPGAAPRLSLKFRVVRPSVSSLLHGKLIS